jgi:hypothetical protein
MTITILILIGCQLIINLFFLLMIKNEHSMWKVQNELNKMISSVFAKHNLFDKP